MECMGDSRCAHWVLVERPEGRKPLGRPTRRREDNIKMVLQAVIWREGARTGLIWLSLQLGECSNETSRSVKCGEFLD